MSAPDYENAADANMDNEYMVTVMADDGTNMDTVMVTVMVTDVGELGMLAGESATITYMENGTDAVGTYTADGPVAASWSVEGDDMGAFSIGGSSGELMFASPPDFEAPADMGMDNIYQVTVKAEAGGEMDTQDVTVTVTNVDEDGTVTLSAMQPQVGVELTAELMDLDGGVTGDTWQWASSDAMDGTYTEIEGATSASYTPVVADANMYLRATAMYTDGEGSGKMAVGMSAQQVTEVSANTAPEFAAETAQRSVAENTVAGMDIGAPVKATDADDDMLTYTLGGDDMASFDIDSATGQLMTMAALDFETETSYSVTVTASDGEDSATVMVTIMVTNVGLDNAYDVDDDGAISRAEAVNAVADFFGGQISREDALAVVAAFFG